MSAFPRGCGHDLPGHDVYTVPYMGWNGTKDAPLLRFAEQGGFDVFVTIDANLVYQQNLRSTVLGIIVFTNCPDSTYDTLHALMPLVAAAVPRITPGAVAEITRGSAATIRQP